MLEHIIDPWVLLLPWLAKVAHQRRMQPRCSERVQYISSVGTHYSVSLIVLEE